MKRFYYVALILLVVFWAGCDSTEPETAMIRTFQETVDLSKGALNQTGDVASVQLNFPEITPAVEDWGAVLVYYWDQNSWTALPFTTSFDDPDLQAVSYTMTLGYAHWAGTLEVFRESSTSDVSPREGIGPIDLKIVIISDFAASKAGIDLRNYEEVKRYFKLPD